MPRRLKRPLPLRTLRLASGKPLPQVSDEFSALIGREVKPQYIILLEHRGVEKHRYLEAFATIYNQPISVVADAASVRQINTTK